MPCPLYSPDEVAQSRTVVTRFDAILRDNGPTEAAELRETAWQVLLADHAARLIARRRALLRQPMPPSGDAA